MSQPEVIRGGVDHLNRPFVKLNVAGFADPLTVFIDTGFNGSIILDKYQAERMGLELTQQDSVSVVLASHRPETFLLSRGRISWLGETPFVSAFVISETEAERLARRRLKREEEIVIGTELLLGCILEIDFIARSVTITRLT